MFTKGERKWLNNVVNAHFSLSRNRSGERKIVENPCCHNLSATTMLPFKQLIYYYIGLGFTHPLLGGFD